MESVAAVKCPKVYDASVSMNSRTPQIMSIRLGPITRFVESSMDKFGVYCKTDARSKTKFLETVRKCATSLRCCLLDWWPKCFKVPPAPGGLTWFVVKPNCQFRSSCTAANKRIWASMLHLAKIWADTPQSLKIGSRLGEFPSLELFETFFQIWNDLRQLRLTCAGNMFLDPRLHLSIRAWLWYMHWKEGV